MLDRKAWDSSIGCVYRTRGGDHVRIECIEEDLPGEYVMIFKLLPAEAHGTVDLNGNGRVDARFDLMEMVRTSNMPKSSGQSCG